MQQREEKGNADAARRGKEAEEHEPGVPYFLEIRRGQVHKQQRRKQRPKHKLVDLLRGVLVQKSRLLHAPAEHHHEEDRRTMALLLPVHA